LELKNPAQIAQKIELEVISSHYGRNVFSGFYWQLFFMKLLIVSSFYFSDVWMRIKKSNLI
jgi:hypothetical protein